MNQGDEKTITVEGSGVNATIIQSDIAATNGFVHIIDHVLGVPYTSVLEKLQSDPMLKWVKMKKNWGGCLINEVLLINVTSYP